MSCRVKQVTQTTTASEKKEAKETEEEKVPTSFEENEAEVEVAEDEITEE